MQITEKKVILACERVQDFLTRNAPPNPPARYAECRAELDELVPRLFARVSEQESGLRETHDDTVRQKKACGVLRRDHLAPISKFAKAALPRDPEIQKSLRMPKANLTTAQLLATAAGMRTTAAKYESRFLEVGLPQDFLAKLDAAIEAIRQTVLSRAQNAGRHIAAKAGLVVEVKRARACLKMLDAMVLYAFRAQPDVIAAWKANKRIGQPPSFSFRGTGGTADENLEPQKAA
jgi:hypothetical protein